MSVMPIQIDTIAETVKPAISGSNVTQLHADAQVDVWPDNTMSAFARMTAAGWPAS